MKDGMVISEVSDGTAPTTGHNSKVVWRSDTVPKRLTGGWPGPEKARSVSHPPIKGLIPSHNLTAHNFP